VPYKLNITNTKIITTVGTPSMCPTGNGKSRSCVPVTLVASPAPALYVTLTTTEEGRFSENSIFVHEKPGAANLTTPSAVTESSFGRRVFFYPFDGMEGARAFDLAAFKSSLRTEDVSMYM
jgi:hypothetical protein